MELYSHRSGLDDAPAAGWVIADRGIIRKRFYAVLDPAGQVTWTDQRSRAHQFSTLIEAELFAQDLIDDDDWVALPRADQRVLAEQ